MNPSIGYFILSLVVFGVLSFIHMVAGIGGIGGASSRPGKYRTRLIVIAIIFAGIVAWVGGSTAFGASAVAAVIVFIFWAVQR